MKTRTLKYIIFLAIVSIAGVLFIQFIFLRNSYNFSEKQFRESATVALKEVAWQLMLEAGHNAANFDEITPVEIISGDLYLVNVDEVFDRESLKQHLIDELKKHEIFTPYEFSVYDPVNKKMDVCKLVKQNNEEEISDFKFPINNNYTNYFGIHFPNRTSYFNSQLSIWYVFSILLLVVLVFFGYTLSVIIKQRQLSEIQKNFINNLTHELKTPISSIGLSAKVLNDKSIIKSPERLFEYSKIIQEQNLRLSKNVEKVLNLASLEKNRLRLNLEKVKLDDLLNEIILHFKQSDYGQKASIQFSVTNNSIKIKTDKFHFTNLAINILENSVKYCENEPVIKIIVEQLKNKIIIKFVDNGIGISKEHRKKIFKKFYRVPTGNVHNVKGFGLGLDYVYKIVKAHGWQIFVNSNPAGGSIFLLSIQNKN